MPSLVEYRETIDGESMTDSLERCPRQILTDVDAGCQLLVPNRERPVLSLASVHRHPEAEDRHVIQVRRELFSAEEFPRRQG